ncbi:hypothetical protein [Paraburkholderia bannensis]|uniref:hypothetical protein n=1 Tax=Paraburkholderia bannensis TaxID=765414 RepID=UPI002ABDC9DC|nr:hypothetical protein [Paraburkholderia bannensis]
MVVHALRPHTATTSLQPSDTARRKNRAFRECAAFDGVREREKAGWTNNLPYPIKVEITRPKWPTGSQKGLCGKDLRLSRHGAELKTICTDGAFSTVRKK